MGNDDVCGTLRMRVPGEPWYRLLFTFTVPPADVVAWDLDPAGNVVPALRGVRMVVNLDAGIGQPRQPPRHVGRKK